MMGPMRSPLLLSAALASLCGCVVDAEWEEFELDRAPFANAWVARGDAEFEVMLAPGYTCPDGRGARVYVVEPTAPPPADAPRPLALLAHDRAFDVRADDGSSLAGEDRLDARWSATRVESVLGMESALGPAAQGEGAWVAALLDAGFAVVAPANCWGDLWHGTGDNAEDEGFLRLGRYLLDDAITLAAQRPEISAETLVVVGLGAGGRAVTELALRGVAIDGAIVDSSTDWLAPYVAQPGINSEEIAALLAIYDAEVGAIADPAAQLAQLRLALERDSLVHVVRDLGWRVPLVYGWSSLDPNVDTSFTQPAADAIATSYPAGSAQVLDWGVADHIPSNRDPVEAASRLAWLLAQIAAAP